MFFEGTVPEAIQASRQQLKPLIVLLTGFDQGSRQVQDALIEQQAEEYAAGSILLALEDDLENMDAGRFSDAKHFRAFCPVEQLPTVVMVSPVAATLLVKVEGVVPAAQLQEQLAAAYAAFRQQQAQALAAQAALAAAAAAAGQRGHGGGAAGEAPAGTQSEAVPAAAAAAGHAAPSAVEAAATPAAAADPAAAAAAAEAAAAQPYQLQFKSTDGSVLRGTFAGGSPVSTVFAWLDEQRAAAGTCRGLAYVLVQAAPRLVVGAAQEGATLAASGVLPRTSLQVIPHAAQGHQPPQPPQPETELEPAATAEQEAQVEQAADPAPQQQQAEAVPGLAQQLEAARQQAAVASAAAAEAAAAHKRKSKAAAAATAAAAAVAAAPPPPPAEVQLQVRLRNGEVLRRAFQPDATLAAVLDWIDAERSDSGAYQLVQPYPKRVFFSGDLETSLLELGFGARTSLQLEPLPPKSRSGTAAAAAAAPLSPSPQEQARAAAAAAAVAAQAEAAKLPDAFTLQFKLTNGEQLRGSFPPEATLQQVCHHLDTHRTDGGAPYQLVQPYPKRRFGPEDLPQPLTELGLQPRQLLLLEPVAMTRGGGWAGWAGGWSVRGAAAAVANRLNPWHFHSLLRGGPAGTAREQAAAAATEEAQPGGELGALGAAADGAADAAADGVPPPSAALQQGGARKRAKGAAAAPSAGGGPNVHTLGGGGAAEGGGGGGEPDGNSYWNGNSTQFDGAPPPPGQP